MTQEFWVGEFYVTYIIVYSRFDKSFGNSCTNNRLNNERRTDFLILFISGILWSIRDSIKFYTLIEFIL